MKPDVTAFQSLPVLDGRFRLGEYWARWPEPDQLGSLVSELVAAGCLLADESVRRALAGTGRGGPGRLGSERTVRRRIRAVVGLNRQQVASARRARQAFALLSTGTPIAEVVHRLGYADQSHLTRSLRSLAGRTPRQILGSAEVPLRGLFSMQTRK